MSRQVSYGSYLNLEQLLSAQNPPGASGPPRPHHHHEAEQHDQHLGQCLAARNHGAGSRGGVASRACQ